MPKDRIKAIAEAPLSTGDDGKFKPQGRKLKGSEVRSTFLTDESADVGRSRNRALVEAAVDQAPPYNNAKDRWLEQYGGTNMNPGMAAREMEKALIPYNDLLASLDIFGETPTNYGTLQQRAEWEPKMAVAITEAIRKWGQFNYNWIYNNHLFKRDGVSVNFFPDTRDWRWEVKGLQYFKFPNQCSPCEDLLPHFGARVTMNVAQLYRYVKNEEYAKEEGWDVSAVKEACRKAQPVGTFTDNSTDYEKYEQWWKNHDITTDSNSPKVELIYYWQQEPDGHMSMYITNYVGDDKTPLLYYCNSKYERASRFMVLYTDGIGTQGTLHSIRGLGQKIFDACVQEARLVSAMLDATYEAGTEHISLTNEDARQSVPFRIQGRHKIYENGATVLPAPTPNLTQTFIPAITMMHQLTESVSSGSSYVSHVVNQGRKTNLMEQNEMAAENQLTSGSMTLFFASFAKLFKEIVRRMARKDYAQDDPGGDEVWWLRNELRRQGVPLEALYSVDVDRIKINTGVGRGSRQARLDSLTLANQKYGEMDAEGRNTLNRLWIQEATGSPRLAQQLFPTEPGQRPGQQAENALRENGILSSQNPYQIMSVQILPDQDHVVHVEYHIQFLNQLFQQVQPTEESQDAMHPVIEPVWTHAVEQWSLISQDDPMYGPSKDQLKQWGEWVRNIGERLITKQQEQAQMAAQQGVQGQEAEQGMTSAAVNNFAKIMDASAKLEIQQQKAQQDMRLKKEDHDMKMAQQVQNMQLKQLGALSSARQPQ